MHKRVSVLTPYIRHEVSPTLLETHGIILPHVLRSNIYCKVRYGIRSFEVKKGDSSIEIRTAPIIPTTYKGSGVGSSLHPALAKQETGKSISWYQSSCSAWRITLLSRLLIPCSSLSNSSAAPFDKCKDIQTKATQNNTHQR